MDNYAAAARLYEARQHPATADPEPGFRIERSKPCKPWFREIHGPEGEYIAVREIGPDHVQIETEYVVTDLTDITIECDAETAWEQIYDAANESYHRLCGLLDDIEQRGAKALREDTGVDRTEARSKPGNMKGERKMAKQADEKIWAANWNVGEGEGGVEKMDKTAEAWEQIYFGRIEQRGARALKGGYRIERDEARKIVERAMTGNPKNWIENLGAELEKAYQKGWFDGQESLSERLPESIKNPSKS